MKKIILVCLVAISANVFAQKELKEGIIKMKATMSSENEQMNAQLAMMGDIVVTTYFKGSKSRSDQSHQMTGDQTSIIDQKTEKSLVLMNNPMLGKKYMKQDLNKNKEQLKNISVIEIGDSKTVLDYKCKGYNIVSKQNGQQIRIKMYVTDKILSQEQYSAMLGGKIKGFPLFMVVTMNQPGIGSFDITMEATEVKGEKIDDAKFDMTIPEGYSELEMPKPANID